MRRGGRLAEVAGFSLAELLVVMAVVTVGTALAVPVTRVVRDAGRAYHAANFVAARLRFARLQAVTEERSVGLVFDLSGDRWIFRVCVDGNRNGIRRADVAAGRDLCPEGPYDLAAMFPGVRVAADPDVAGPDGSPGSADPVRFGRADLVSFSPSGSCTSGSLVLWSDEGQLYMVRVAGVTARTRVLFYDRPEEAWRPA